MTGPPALQHMAIQALDGCFRFLKNALDLVATLRIWLESEFALEYVGIGEVQFNIQEWGFHQRK